MHWPVWGCVSHIHKEGIDIVVARMFADESRSVVRNGIGVVKLLGLVFRIGEWCNQRVVANQGVGIEEAAGTMNRSVEPVKAALQWPITSRFIRLWVIRLWVRFLGDVPLASHISAIATGLQNLSDRDAATIEVTSISIRTTIFHHMTDPSLVGIEPSQQGCTGGAATSGVIKLRKSNAAFG